MAMWLGVAGPSLHRAGRRRRATKPAPPTRISSASQRHGSTLERHESGRVRNTGEIVSPPAELWLYPFGGFREIDDQPFVPNALRVLEPRQRARWSEGGARRGAVQVPTLALRASSRTSATPPPRSALLADNSVARLPERLPGKSSPRLPFALQAGAQAVARGRERVVAGPDNPRSPARDTPAMTRHSYLVWISIQG